MLKGQSPITAVSLWNIAANTYQAIYRGILTSTTCNTTCNTTYWLLSQLGGLHSNLWGSTYANLAATASTWGLRTASIPTPTPTPTPTPAVSVSSILLKC